MSYDPIHHHRRSTRLLGYDYTQAGLYFVTVVTWQRECLLGEIEAAEVMLSPVGQVAHREWKRLRSRFPGLEVDEFVIMPNHIHGIVVIHDRRKGVVGAQQEIGAIEDNSRSAAPPPRPNNVVPKSLGALVRAFKSIDSLPLQRHAIFKRHAPLAA